MKFMSSEEVRLWIKIYTKAFEQNYPEPDGVADDAVAAFRKRVPDATPECDDCL